ncbi:MAG: metallophosphoesterase, partial [Bryobacteraceae bacterium]
MNFHPSRREIVFGGCLARTAFGAAAPEPLFRFLQVNDLHFKGSTVVNSYAGANRRAEWLFERISKQDFFPRLDFVVVVGDLVHGESLEGLREELPVVREKLDALGIPFYTALGNHENVQREGDEVYEQPYRDTFGSDRVQYSFVRHGIEFIVVNNSGSAGNRPKSVFDERLQRLDRMLSANPRLPKLVFCHIPLVAIREEPVLAKSFGFSSYRAKEPELLELVEARASSVRAVLSGHLHLTGMVKEKGVAHASICGTASYPHDVALYSVFPDRIEAEVIRLPSNLLAPETNIHGFRRHGIDY